MPLPRRLLAALAVLLSTVATSACLPLELDAAGTLLPVPSSGPTSGALPPPAPVGAALAALPRLPIKGRAPKTGYHRTLFGPAWLDTDRNGCDTRNDVLRRDLADDVIKAGTHGCILLSGTLADPYTGKTILFVRGQDTSNAVQIDHVVALADAWQKGAQQWTAARRGSLANDSLNLLAVDGPTNQRKGDGDAATWLPVRSDRCAYAARIVAVKAAYALWVTAAEHDALAGILATCPNQLLPTREPFVLGPDS